MHFSIILLQTVSPPKQATAFNLPWYMQGGSLRSWVQGRTLSKALTLIPEEVGFKIRELSLDLEGVEKNKTLNDPLLVLWAQ